MQIDLFEQQTAKEYEQRFKKFYSKQLQDKKDNERRPTQTMDISITGVVRPVMDVINEFKNKKL
jgi:hypothetical protein